MIQGTRTGVSLTYVYYHGTYRAYIGPINTHYIGIYRAYIGISHRGTLGSGYIHAYPLNDCKYLCDHYQEGVFSLKLTANAPENGWLGSMKFPIGARPIFRGYVSFTEGTSNVSIYIFNSKNALNHRQDFFMPRSKWQTCQHMIPWQRACMLSTRDCPPWCLFFVQTLHRSCFFGGAWSTESSKRL